MTRYPRPWVRRSRLGKPRPFDTASLGRIVTVEGVLDGPDELMAESMVALTGLLSCERSPEPVHLHIEGVELLIEGVVAVVVGSCELEYQADGYGWLSLRQLVRGARVRARGRLRRVTAPNVRDYRTIADVWALCPTGTAETVDIACEDAPRMEAKPGKLVGTVDSAERRRDRASPERAPLEEEPVEVEPDESDPDEVLSQLLHRRWKRRSDR